MNKKSNLDLLLLELFEEQDQQEQTQYFSVEAEPETATTTEEQYADIEDAEVEAGEVEDELHTPIGTVIKDAESLHSSSTPETNAQPGLDENAIGGLTEGDSERGGIKQQSFICAVLKRAKQYKNWQFISNKKGEQFPDITIVPPSGTPSYVEVKSREGGLVAIYDKTVRLDSYDVAEFDDIAKALAKQNNVKVFEKRPGGQIREVDVSTLQPGRVFQAILTQGAINPKGKPECGRYGKLKADPEAIQNMRKKAYKMRAKYCSHKPAGFFVKHPDSGKIIQAFIPNGSGVDLEANNKVYFYNPTNKIYTEINVSTKYGDDDWVRVQGKYYLAPDGKVRPAGDAGTVSGKCFSYRRDVKKSNNPEVMSDSGNAVVNIAHNTIMNHWKKESGADDYFMIAAGRDIYPFLIPGRPNPLNLPIPVFTPDVINSVQLTTYGKAGENAIRLAIKCDILMSTTLQSLLTFKESAHKENVELLLKKLLG